MFERKSHNLIKINSHIMVLDVERLELILVRFSFGRSFRKLAQTYKSQQKHQNNHSQYFDSLPQQFFCNIITRLNYILHHRTSRLKMDDVLFLHESIGIMRVMNGNFSGAIGSFTRALWIQRHSDDWFHVGVTQQRLATAYRQQGNKTKDYAQALKMFQKALHNYKKSGLDNSTPHVSSVADEMVDLIERIEGLSERLIQQNGKYLQTMRKTSMDLGSTGDGVADNNNNNNNSQNNNNGLPESHHTFMRSISQKKLSI
mmetsp:Transcript_16784/g.23699  ORF Transcript_16784/g.23699 Transcript_16784/m.23699 type:complete len:258 (-) Transcript_16784:298-1071(-)